MKRFAKRKVRRNMNLRFREINRSKLEYSSFLDLEEKKIAEEEQDFEERAIKYLSSFRAYACGYTSSSSLWPS